MGGVAGAAAEDVSELPPDRDALSLDTDEDSDDEAVFDSAPFDVSPLSFGVSAPAAGGFPFCE